MSSPEHCELYCSEIKQQSLEFWHAAPFNSDGKVHATLCLLLVFLTLEDNAMSVSEVHSHSNMSLLDLSDSTMVLFEHSINTATAIATLNQFQ